MKKKIPPCLALGSFLMGACCVLSAMPETRQVPGDAGSPSPGDAVARGFAETLGKARPPAAIPAVVCKASSLAFFLHHKPPLKSCTSNRGQSLQARRHRLPPKPRTPNPVLPSFCSISFQKYLSVRTACLSVF